MIICIIISQFVEYYSFSDLNPIELTWKDVKHQVKKKNLKQDLNAIKQVAEEVLRSYSKEFNANNFKHVKK